MKNPEKKTQAKNVIYETLPRVQGDVFQIGVEWTESQNQAHS